MYLDDKPCDENTYLRLLQQELNKGSYAGVTSIMLDMLLNGREIQTDEGILKWLKT